MTSSAQLLILGNGFDLHCGLKSSYKDFFRSEIFDAVNEPLGLKQLKSGVSGFWESLLLEYYKIDSKYDYSWCSIETIIRDTLWLIYYGEERKFTNLANGLWQTALNFIKERRDIYDDKIYKDKPLKRFIFCYLVYFFERIKFENYSKEEKLCLLGRQLLNELNNLEKRFCKYIKNQTVNPHNGSLNENYVINVVNLLTNLTGILCPSYKKLSDIIITEKKYSETHSGDDAVDWSIKNEKRLNNKLMHLNKIFILNFNYTALFDILDVKSPCVYNNVHGKLCSNVCMKGCNKSNIIFGIDDNLIQSQDTSSELRLFSKTYRKMLNSEKYIKALPPNDEQVIAIKFYGHSLSEADYSYFQSIFDYYDLYENSKVSLIFYYSKGFENHDAVYKLISGYGKSLTNKEQGKNLVHKLLLENRLEIVEVL